MNRYKLIYNPQAGQKRRKISSAPVPNFEMFRKIARQYELPLEIVSVHRPGQARQLAAASAKQRYDAVIVAGGDGTVAEVAHGLVDTETAMGILPLGTFMNTAKMLSIPHDLDRAMLIIKTGKIRRIDLGRITVMSGKTPREPWYFLESAGVGAEAELQKVFFSLERKRYLAAARSLAQLPSQNHREPLTIQFDHGKEITVPAASVNIANGPLEGANVDIAPEAKVTDRRFTISVFTMNLVALGEYALAKSRSKKQEFLDREVFQASRVRIDGSPDRQVHADGKLFGGLPAEFSVAPSSLKVITGFPEDKQEAAVK